MTTLSPDGRKVEATHMHLFCGMGGFAIGFNAAKAEHAGMTLTWRCLGGIDSNPAAIADFGQLVGVPGTLLDLFNEDQYRRFHGHAPPTGWREATGRDILASGNWEHPDAVCLSPPCKGTSSLMSEAQSLTPRYQALNELTLRGIMLMLDAYAERLPRLVILENVPMIRLRGRALLDRIGALLRASGYHVAESKHDCGEIGGLAQSRPRFLLVARLATEVPAGLYQAPKRRLRGVGEVIGQMPMPGDPSYGPMHRVPLLSWKTWTRLAFVEAGSDWKSLRNLRVEDGTLADYAIVGSEADHRNGFLGVGRWDEPSGVVAGRNLPTNGRFATADPRIDAAVPVGQSASKDRPSGWSVRYTHLMVPRQEGQSLTAPMPGNPERAGAGVRRWDQSTGTLTSQRSPLQGGFSVADPRPTKTNQGRGKYGVTGWSATSRTVIAASATGNGACAVADPRAAAESLTPTGDVLPKPDDRVIAVIRSLDGCWHRPFTTWELAVLQSIAGPLQPPLMAGTSDTDHRERLGNCVPPLAAEAIGETMGRTLLLAIAGKTFILSNVPLWVRGLCTVMSVDPTGHLGHDPRMDG